MMHHVFREKTPMKSGKQELAIRDIEKAAIYAAFFDPL
jgi:hypothetical protein